jgi:hypothetical protein
MQDEAARKEERRSKIRQAKMRRAVYGKNMFANEVRVKSVEPDSKPVGANASYYTRLLRPASQFTGTPYEGLLAAEDRAKLRRIGLPTSAIVKGIHPLMASYSFRPGETIGPLEQTLSYAIAEENDANARRTKAASSPNNSENVNANANEFIRTMPNRIRQQQEERAALFAHPRPPAEQEALRRAAAAAGYSAGMARVLGPSSSRPSLIERFSSPQSAVSPLSLQQPSILQGLKPHPNLVLRPLNAGSHGGRSRKQRSKMRKSRNKRRTRKH